MLAEVALFVSFHAQANRSLELLASLNALQLTLIKRIMQLAASHPLLMPDSAFIDQLFLEAKRAGFERKLASAFQQCLIEVAQPNPAADKGGLGEETASRWAWRVQLPVGLLVQVAGSPRSR